MIELQILASAILFLILILLKCYDINQFKKDINIKLFKEYKDSLDVV